MGWLGGWFGGSSSSDESDPLGKLDPKLREFLARESPVKYTTQQEQEQQQQQQQAKQAPTVAPVPRTTATEASKQQQTQKDEQQTDGKPVVPSASLYQDGRYAHLWKNYRPQYEIENETKTDHEKLMDVLEGFKERKAMIGKAALENCAEEQLDWSNCMKYGSWADRATMCRDTVRKFERCYNMQSVCFFVLCAIVSGADDGDEGRGQYMGWWSL